MMKILKRKVVIIPAIISILCIVGLLPEMTVEEELAYSEKCIKMLEIIQELTGLE